MFTTGFYSLIERNIQNPIGKSWENQGRINLLGFDVIKEIYNTWKKLSISINIHLNVSSSADADITNACNLKFVILAHGFSEP